jgi:spore maturation protein CgeB
MQDKTDVLELEKQELEASKLKNTFIGDTTEAWLIFLDKTVTNRTEVEEVITAYEFLSDYDVIVFAQGIPEGEIDLFSMLDSFSMQIFAMVVKRSLFEYTGCFHEKLCAMTNYEFLCRAAKKGRVYGIPCQGDVDNTPLNPHTMAYIARRYMRDMQKQGVLEAVFSHMDECMQSCNCLEEFHREINVMLNEPEAYEKMAENTAPFFIISGDDTCHGVLKDFAVSLAGELVSLGQAVVTTGREYGNFQGFDAMADEPFKGFIGFQAPVLEDKFFRNLKGKKFQFWFDNPCFFNGVFHGLGKEYYILCQDQYYAQHIRTFYQAEHAIQFPPAGKTNISGVDIGHSDRKYDIVFIGTYNPVRPEAMNEPVQKAYFEFMLQNPKMTFEQGLEGFLEKYGTSAEKNEFLQILWSLADVCRNVIYYFRKKIVETILQAGYPVHVFGDSWNAYDGQYRDRLVLHPAVSVQESMEILSQSKIGLNVMTWHKAGMTERIANIMLSGAVCLSDESLYLRENFVENEEIVLFELDHLEDLPQKLQKLLENEDERKQIAQKAYQKACREHTWKKRAQDLLKLVDGE